MFRLLKMNIKGTHRTSFNRSHKRIIGEGIEILAKTFISKFSTFLATAVLPVDLAADPVAAADVVQGK